MPESDVMPTEQSSVKFLLDKPLQELTEDDIAQVTREDCRRYLKEKGMRRPSWNKSQAIQQVIMLKTLLETTPDCDLGSRKRLRVPRHDNSHDNGNCVPESVPKATCNEAQNSFSADVTAPYRRKDLDKPDSLSGYSVRFPAANHDPAQHRAKGSADISGQMTIFYCGKVNVYDDMQADKARALLQLAASPLESSKGQPVDGTMILQPLSRLSKGVSTKANPDSGVVFLPTLQTAKTIDNSLKLGEEGDMFHEETSAVEGLPTRKASVQRYLEKRNRFKSKIKTVMTSCTSFDVYSNHQGGNEMASRSKTCSPTQNRPHFTPTQSSSVDNDSVNNVCPPAVINKKGL